MVALQLQDDLAKELEIILSPIRLKCPKGKMVPYNVFKHSLPICDDYSQDSNEPYPYVIVQVDSGSVQDSNSAQYVKIILILGIFDDMNDNRGSKDALNAIQKIYERFAKNPILNNKYILNFPFEWALQSEDRYPYYFAGIETVWITAGIEKEGLECLERMM